MNPRFALVVALVLALAMNSGCAAFRPQVNPAVYQAKKVAVLTYYGPVKVNSYGGGLVSAIQSATNKYGVKIAESTVDEVIGRLNAMKIEIVPPATVMQSAEYAQLPEATYPESYIAPRGMRAVSTAKEHDAALARLAKTLAVDAVMIVKADWQVQLIDDQDPVGHSRLEVLIVGADGTRLYDATGFRGFTAEGKSDTSIGSAFAAVAGALTEESALKMSRAALRASLDKFLDKWGR